MLANHKKDSIMKGTLVYLMGASGSGKDSLLSYAKKYFDEESCTRQLLPSVKPPIFVRRHITRIQNAGGEDHIHLTTQAFTKMVQDGQFIMYWQSHGLQYGITRQVSTWLRNGQNVVINGSRNYLETALTIVPDLLPVQVCAQQDALRQRLLQRGRETAQEIEERLSKAEVCTHLPNNTILLDNSVCLEKAGEKFIHLLENLISIP